MYRHAVDLQGQDAAGLDMFVGSGVDFLSEVTIEDMDRDLFASTSSVPGQLGAQHFGNFSPLATTLGPPGAATGFDPRFGIPTLSQPSQRQFQTAGQGQTPDFSLGALADNTSHA